LARLAAVESAGHFPKKHSRFPHVFVVCRIDTFGEKQIPVDEDLRLRMTTTKVFAEQAEAEAEAARLNGEVGGDSYFVQISRWASSGPPVHNQSGSTA
jgi:hypothetical protein